MVDTERAPRWPQFHVQPAVAVTIKRRLKSTTSVDIIIVRAHCVKLIIQICMRLERSESARKHRIAL